MTERIKCISCDNMILPSTAERNEGKCGVCAKGPPPVQEVVRYRGRVEAKNLREAAEGCGIPEHYEKLADMAKPCININRGGTNRLNRLGGRPLLPEGFAWPKHQRGDYAFLGQFDTDVLNSLQPVFQPGGVLSLFYMHDEDLESFWGDPDYILARCLPKTEAMVETVLPESVRFGEGYQVELSAGVDLPSTIIAAEDEYFQALDEGVLDAYWEVKSCLHGEGKYLLGFPDFTSLNYDPTPADGFRSLITVDSDDDLVWCWHDGDILSAFIHEDKLRSADYSEIKADAG